MVIKNCLISEVQDYKVQQVTKVTRIYHIAYEPTYESLNIHLWTNCNLKCRCCYANYEINDFGLIDDPVEKIIYKSPVDPPSIFLTIDELLERLEGLKVNYVSFLGTEPSLDPMLPEIAKVLKQNFNSYNILLTNGLKLNDMEHIDQVIVSLKAYSEDLHVEYTGRSNERILSNFVKLHNMDKNLQAETVLIPGYIDCEEIERIARFIASVDPKIPFRIDAYFRVPGKPWSSATRQQVEKAAELSKKYLEKVDYLSLDMKRIGEKAKRIF